MEGWLKLYRKMVDWEWYGDANTLQLFIHLLLTVRPKAYRRNGETLPAGSRVGNATSIAEELGVDVRIVRKSLQNLIQSGDVSLHKKYDADRHPIIRVTNWGKYNNIERDNEPCYAENAQQNAGQTELQTDHQSVGQSVCYAENAQQNGVCYTKNAQQATEKESFTKEKELELKEDTLTCVQERARTCAERDTHNNEFSNFTSSIDPYPRTTDEVKTAAALQGIAMTDEEARAFIDYNASVGWMARGEPIRRWKALLNGWHQQQLLRERRSKANGNGNNQNGWRDSQGRWNNKAVAHDGDFGEPEPIAE